MGRLACRGLRAVIGAARAGERPSLSRVLTGHLGAGAGTVDVIEETWPAYAHVNVQAGLEVWLADRRRTSELVGIANFQHMMFGWVTCWVARSRTGRCGRAARRRSTLPAVRTARSAPCLRCGVYLVVEGDVRTILLLRGASPEFGLERVSLQIVSTDPAAAPRAATEIRTAVLEHNVFRGQVLSFGSEVFGHGQTLLQFHRRPTLHAHQLILRPDTLAEVQRQVVGVARHKRRLLASGQHLKRGLLLYGPPGVGKTHTVRYLTSSLAGTTVLQLTGNALHLVAEACSVARACSRPWWSSRTST